MSYTNNLQSLPNFFLPKKSFVNCLAIIFELRWIWACMGHSTAKVKKLRGKILNYYINNGYAYPPRHATIRSSKRKYEGNEKLYHHKKSRQIDKVCRHFCFNFLLFLDFNVSVEVLNLPFTRMNAHFHRTKSKSRDIRNTFEYIKLRRRKYEIVKIEEQLLLGHARTKYFRFMFAFSYKSDNWPSSTFTD